MKTKKIFNNLGISIIEVMVAIMIITTGMIGVLSLVIQNIEVQFINKNVLIASVLAGEGLELVRNVRDLNWLTPGDDLANDWKRNIVGDNTYVIDYNGVNNKICGGGSNEGINCTQNSDCNSNVCRPINVNMDINSIDEVGARLYIDNNGFYTHIAAGNTLTNFYRLITVALIEDPADSGKYFLDVKCTIRWRDGIQNHNYTAETHLYNWR